ncbi:hypothetical protein [uncultured Neglectibacter sp.]|uniref:hypothetical protein n=1 Tax=uncultured Neglectibacter sp. TaxID=1924108 RepID=UPI0034E0389D
MPIKYSIKSLLPKDFLSPLIVHDFWGSVKACFSAGEIRRGNAKQKSLHPKRKLAFLQGIAYHGGEKHPAKL